MCKGLFTSALLELERNNVLPIITIYDDPEEFPGKVIARLFMVVQGSPEPVDTEVKVVGESLDEVRESIPFGLFRIPRYQADHPTVVESWL